MADRDFLDWPFFDESHRVLARDLDAWAAETLPGLHDHADVDGSCRRIVKALGDGGWLAHAMPKSHGGPAERLEVRSLALIRETLARHDGLADFAFAMQGLGTGSITLAGTDEQKDRYLPGVRSGEKIAAFALSEPDAGSDVAAMSTSAEELADGGFRLDGAKTWISNGGIADQYVVFARDGGAPGAKGLSAFIVDADTPGLEIAERIDVIAPHPLATLKFDDCRIPASARLGGPGDGFRIAMGTLDIFRTTVGAAGLGLARRALDEALEHASTRKMFGGTLADFQLTQAALAEMATEIDASALLVYRAAWTRDMGADRITREASMAKMYATEAAQRIIDKAVQMHGGQGVRVGTKVEELYRDIRALRIYEGATEVQKVVIARQELGRFAKGETRP